MIIICWLVGICKINFLLPLHIENNGNIVLFIFFFLILLPKVGEYIFNINTSFVK